MKFRNYLETIIGVDVYPMASLLIFFLFFTALAIWAVRVNRDYINHMRHMPINNDKN